jgi:hypothetical protein
MVWRCGTGIQQTALLEDAWISTKKASGWDVLNPLWMVLNAQSCASTVECLVTPGTAVHLEMARLSHWPVMCVRWSVVDVVDVVTMIPGIGVQQRGMAKEERVMSRVVEKGGKVVRVAREAGGLLLERGAMPDHLVVEALLSKISALHRIWFPVPNWCITGLKLCTAGMLLALTTLRSSSLDNALFTTPSSGWAMMSGGGQMLQ